jgi:hypothetical protein
MASTPVSAEQPDANAFSTSSAPTDSVVCGSVCDRATAGCARARPTAITAKIATINAIVGTMKIRAASAIPHMFAPVIAASTTRQIQTRAP